MVIPISGNIMIVATAAFLRARNPVSVICAMTIQARDILIKLLQSFPPLSGVVG